MAIESKRAIALALILAPLPFAPVANAQLSAAALHAGSLDIPLNKSQVVSADRPIAKAMVGSADIADVLPVTDRSIYVLGKKMGTTSLTLYDAANRVMSIMDIAVGPDVNALMDQIHSLIPGEKIEAHISNQSIVLTGLVNNGASAERATQLAHAYLEKCPEEVRKNADDEIAAGLECAKVINMISVGSSQQVMLEVRFAEVKRSAEKDIGVSAFGLSRGGSFDGVMGSGATLVPDPVTGVGVMKLNPITDTFGIFRKMFRIGSVNIDGILNALEQRGLSKTLAQPTLVALSGERASFLAGGEFPIPVAQNGSGNNTNSISVEFKPFGVSLAFTPTVLGDKTISMIVEPEVSEIDPSVSLSLGTISIPGLRTRRASTTLEMRDGESFAIAGLLQNDFKTAIKQLPLLGSIPIIGALFRSTDYQKGESELLIVVTPHLVAPLRPEQVRLPTDRVLDPREADAFLLGQPYRPQAVAPAVPAPPAPQPSSPTQPKKDGYAY